MPVVLGIGATGLLARGHRRVVWLLAIAAPLLSVLALAAQFRPGGAESCTSSINGTSACQSLPAVSGWDGPLPFVIAAVLILLSLAPLGSAHTCKWWPAAVSALMQLVAQGISFGGFIEWAPALAVTIAVAFAVTPQRRRPIRAPQLPQAET